MVKQIMQDVVAKKNKGEASGGDIQREMQREAFKAAPRTHARAPVVEDSLEIPPEDSSHDGGDIVRDSGAGPSFAPIDSSPIFEKMKRRNKDRESFSDEFDNDQKKETRNLFRNVSFLSLCSVFSALSYMGSFFTTPSCTLLRNRPRLLWKIKNFLSAVSLQARSRFIS